MSEFIISKENDTYKIKTTEEVNSIIIDFRKKFERHLFFIISVNGKKVRNSHIAEFRPALDSGKFVRIPQIIEKDCLVEIKFEGFDKKIEIENIHLYWNSEMA